MDLTPLLRLWWKPINKNTNTSNIWLQVFEDYSEEEQEKYKEELETIKKRFSHTKLKRKWVSFSKVFFRLWDIYDWSEKSFSPLFTGLASADNKGSLIFKTQSSKLVANLFIGCIWYRNTTTGPLVTACITTLHRVVMGGYFRFQSAQLFLIFPTEIKLTWRKCFFSFIAFSLRKITAGTWWFYNVFAQ